MVGACSTVTFPGMPPSLTARHIDHRLQIEAMSHHISLVGPLVLVVETGTQNKVTAQTRSVLLLTLMAMPL